MIVLKTIPEVPAVPAVVDSVYKVSIMSIDFINSTVTFNVTSTYTPLSDGMARFGQTAPTARTVSFAEIGALVTPTDVSGFITVVRNALALAMNVTLDKVPEDIFAS